jgi:hypothetical protein
MFKDIKNGAIDLIDKKMKERIEVYLPRRNSVPKRIIAYNTLNGK